MEIMDAKATFGKSSTSILFFVILTLSILISTGCSSGDDPTTTTTTTTATPSPTPPPQPPTAIDQILVRSLTSNYNSETYPLIIFLPAVFETDKNLPVIYLTDGARLFEILLQKSKEIGLQAIIVAIGDKEGTDRIRDYSPSFCGGTAIGFENYYNLITKQLVPFVDNNYENDHSSRSLIGYSFGGRFAVAALLMENPEAVIFHSSIAVDPAFACGGNSFGGLINELDDFIVSANSTESFKLFRTRSSELGPNGFNEYMEARDMDLPWFDFDFMDLANEDHQSVIGPSFVAGLRYVYDIN